jgi:acyl-CoA synthetase (AMP-forming)/AMP-acid ligase II
MRSADGRVRGAGTIVDVLLARAEDETGAGFGFLTDGESLTEMMPWPALVERAVAVSSALERHAGIGDRAVLFFRPGLDFLVAFLGCLHAGVVAVPCAPPSRPLRRSFERIDEVVRVASPSVIMASGKTLSVARDLGAMAPALERCPLIDPCGLPRASDPPPSRADRNALAFLQFTSGSTSAPKGVMVTHANLMNNLDQIHECVQHSRDSVTVTWLPVFHDMGLIDGMLEPLFGGFRCYAMPPVAFLQRPVRWLSAITRYRATHSGGPNFAYDLCVEKVAPVDRAGLDLSSWRVAHDGAEPIRPSTFDSFARAFEASGFRASAFYPCYGLAEATLGVASGPADRLHPRTFDATALEQGELHEVDAGAPRARTIASSGVPFTGVAVAIVDPEARRKLPDGEIGEIWVSGPSVAAGYYGNAEATQESFRARTRPDDDGPFLRTGDLGFVRGAELYVVGRRKDMIILSGRNIYPQDVERSAESAHPTLSSGGAVAFAIDDGRREHLVVLVESEHRPSPSDGGTTLRDVIDAVGRAIGRDHQVDASIIAVVPAGALLKTSSGKIRRQACKRAFRVGAIEAIDRVDLVPIDERASA